MNTGMSGTDKVILVFNILDSVTETSKNVTAIMSTEIGRTDTVITVFNNLDSVTEPSQNITTTITSGIDGIHQVITVFNVLIVLMLCLATCIMVVCGAHAAYR